MVVILLHSKLKKVLLSLANKTHLHRGTHMQAFHPYPLTNCHSLDGLTDEETQVSRQSYAGLLWSKQFYHYIIQDWLKGDPETPAPPRDRLKGRNSEAEWAQLFNRDVVSMPDKWEYPWVSRTIINVFFSNLRWHYEIMTPSLETRR